MDEIYIERSKIDLWRISLVMGVASILIHLSSYIGIIHFYHKCRKWWYDKWMIYIGHSYSNLDELLGVAQMT